MPRRGGAIGKFGNFTGGPVLRGPVNKKKTLYDPRDVHTYFWGVGAQVKKKAPSSLTFILITIKLPTVPISNLTVPVLIVCISFDTLNIALFKAAVSRFGVKLVVS